MKVSYASVAAISQITAPQEFDVVIGKYGRSSRDSVTNPGTAKYRYWVDTFCAFHDRCSEIEKEQVAKLIVDELRKNYSTDFWEVVAGDDSWDGTNIVFCWKREKRQKSWLYCRKFNDNDNDKKKLIHKVRQAMRDKLAKKKAKKDENHQIITHDGHIKIVEEYIDKSRSIFWAKNINGEETLIWPRPDLADVQPDSPTTVVLPVNYDHENCKFICSMPLLTDGAGKNDPKIHTDQVAYEIEIADATRELDTLTLGHSLPHLKRSHSYSTLLSGSRAETRSIASGLHSDRTMKTTKNGTYSDITSSISDSCDLHDLCREVNELRQLNMRSIASWDNLQKLARPRKHFRRSHNSKGSIDIEDIQLPSESKRNLSHYSSLTFSSSHCDGLFQRIIDRQVGSRNILENSGSLPTSYSHFDEVSKVDFGSVGTFGYTKGNTHGQRVRVHEGQQHFVDETTSVDKSQVQAFTQPSHQGKFQSQGSMNIVIGLRPTARRNLSHDSSVTFLSHHSEDVLRRNMEQQLGCRKLPVAGVFGCNSRRCDDRTMSDQESIKEWSVAKLQVTSRIYCTPAVCVTLRCDQGFECTLEDEGISTVDAVKNAVIRFFNVAGIDATHELHTDANNNFQVQATATIRDTASGQTFFGSFISDDSTSSVAYAYVDAMNKVVRSRIDANNRLQQWLI